MMKTDAILDTLARGETVEHADLAALLTLTDPDELAALYARAYEVKLATVGPVCYFRGIVEMSNRCVKDCYYCGIRRSNRDVERYLISEDEIVTNAMWAHEQRYGSIVLQAGERTDPAYTEMVTRVLQRVKEESGGELGVTLSLGEQTAEVYRDWFAAGAHRYLLRIETSNRELYGQIHPPDHDFDARQACLQSLRDVGFQVGTGVMTGLPGQTAADLANDIQFFKDHDVDMIGMGPYIVHKDTPLANEAIDYDGDSQFELGLKMIAVTRLALRDVNIAATTALQALNPTGRELGLQAGANIVMPNITHTRFRSAYQLYEGKPCLEDDSGMCKGCLAKRVHSIGETIGLGKWGDSPHFAQRTLEEA